MKSKDLEKLGVLRYLLSEIQKKEIELRVSKEELTDEHVFKVIRKQIKNRMQSIELYEKGNRPDLVEKEQKEMEILKEYAKMFPFELNLDPGQRPQGK
jgi:uncharacterized protein YqeY